MINNNPTPQEHKKNIKDFLTGTAELIFDNQEKITNGEYVELNRMIAEITIVNNRGGSSSDRDTIMRQNGEQLRQDAVINSLEHRNSVLEGTEQLLADRNQQLRRENEELKQRLETIRTMSYPQATQTQTQQPQVQPVVQPQVQPQVQQQQQNHRFTYTDTAPEDRYTQTINSGDTRRIRETGSRRTYAYLQNPETLRYVKRNGRTGREIERVCLNNITATTYAPTLKLIVGRMSRLNGQWSDADIREHTEIVHFIKLTPQQHEQGNFLYEYQVF